MMKSAAIIVSLMMFNLGAALTMQEKKYIEQMKKERQYELQTEKIEKQAEEQHAIHKSANELVAGKVTPKQIVATRRGGDKQGAVRATLKKEINKEHRRMKAASRKGDVWEANRAYSEMTEAAQRLGKDVLKSHKGSLGASKMSLMEKKKMKKMKRISFEKQVEMMMDERKTPDEVGLNPKHVQKYLKSYPDQQKVQQYEVSKDLRKQVKEGKVPNPTRAADDFMREANVPRSVRKDELKKQEELKKQQEKAAADLQESLQRQKDDAAWTATEFAKSQKRQHDALAKLNTRPQLRKQHEQEKLKEADLAKSAKHQKDQLKKSDYEAQLLKQRVKKTSHPLKPRMKDLKELYSMPKK